MANTYTLISSNVLSSSAASVTFSAIPSTYTDLVLRASTRGSTASVGIQIRTRANNSSSAVYSYTMLQGTGSATSSGRLSSTTSLTEAWTAGASATANTFGSWELYIPSYTASQSKPMSSFSVSENNATEAYVSAAAYLFADNTAISELNIIRPSGTFDIGSSFYLYGIKNS